MRGVARFDVVLRQVWIVKLAEDEHSFRTRSSLVLAKSWIDHEIRVGKQTLGCWIMCSVEVKVKVPPKRRAARRLKPQRERERIGQTQNRQTALRQSVAAYERQRG